MTEPRKCPECGAEMVLWEGMWLCPSSPYEHEIAALKAELEAAHGYLRRELKHAGEYAREINEARMQAEAQLTAAREEAGRMRAAVEWVLKDAAYRPPEHFTEFDSRWLDRLQGAITEQQESNHD